MALPKSIEDREYNKFLVDINGNTAINVINSDGSMGGSSTNLEGKGIIQVTTTATAIAFTGTTESIILTSGISSTDVIYVGTSSVSSTGANAITFLDVGESLTIDYNDVTNTIYVVTASGTQYLFAGASL